MKQNKTQNLLDSKRKALVALMLPVVTNNKRTSWHQTRGLGIMQILLCLESGKPVTQNTDVMHAPVKANGFKVCRYSIEEALNKWLVMTEMKGGVLHYVMHTNGFRLLHDLRNATGNDPKRVPCPKQATRPISTRGRPLDGARQKLSAKTRAAIQVPSKP